MRHLAHRTAALAVAGLLLLGACSSGGDELAVDDGVANAFGDGATTGTDDEAPLTNDPAATGNDPAAVGSPGDQAPGSPAPGTTGNTSSSDPAGGSDRPVPGSSGAPTGGVSTPPGPGGAPSKPPAGHPAVTDDTITIGFLVQAGSAQAFADTFGISGLSVGDGEAAAQAIVDVINANGGTAGRTLEVIYHEWDPAGNRAAEWEAACNTFTQDNTTMVVATQVAGVWDELYDCLARAGTAHVQDSFAGFREQYDRYPNLLFSPSDIVSDRLIDNMIDTLEAQGWFGDAPVIASYRYDRPLEDRLVEQVLKPALARHGYELRLDMRITIEGEQTEVNGLVLQANSAGVTHVIPFPSPLFFMIAADSQGYRPDYALQTGHGPGALLEGAAPRRQLEGAMGVGWAPDYDLNANNSPGPVTPTNKFCIDTIAAAGEDMTAPTTRAVAMSICDQVLFIDRTLDVADEVSPAGITRAMAKLGSMESAYTWNVDWNAPAERDGLGSYRVIAFDDDCGCFQYATDLLAIR